jgi:hypothetical protein
MEVPPEEREAKGLDEDFAVAELGQHRTVNRIRPKEVWG